MSWQPIETAIEEARETDGWISRCLFGKNQAWGWATWVGQCDDGDLWLGVMEDGSCWECETPTHWMPLPEPPQESVRGVFKDQCAVPDNVREIMRDNSQALDIPEPPK